MLRVTAYLLLTQAGPPTPWSAKGDVQSSKAVSPGRMSLSRILGKQEEVCVTLRATVWRSTSTEIQLSYPGQQLADGTKQNLEAINEPGLMNLKGQLPADMSVKISF